jgi:hypothetical protein
VDVDADDNAPSVLRLFSEPSNERPKRFTEWDRAFLNGSLYRTDQRDRQQRGQIVTTMLNGIEH